ncbi:MAG: hypothetical protein ACOC6H_01040 [Thermoproteota archaeon]
MAILAFLLLLGLTTVGVFQKKPEVMVGVELGYDNVGDIVRFVDEVEDYVNLVVIGSLQITTNATRLTQVCDYLYHKGLYFIPFMFFTQFLEEPDFFQMAKERWGERFLGLYLSDEPGGRQFDPPEHRVISEAENYSEAAYKYVHVLNQGFQNFFDYFDKSGNVTTFVADYTLYWFDYQAGYDTVFAEFGWNYSRQLHVALCRGAATAQDKDWGAIVTWTYRHPPYIEDPQQLYQDLVLAYNSGARYIIVFNHPTNQTQYGLLTRDHLNSLQKFWNYIHATPQPPSTANIAYVLPENYGYGFMGPDSKIWGLWGPDELSSQVWNQANHLLATYGARLDIIYNHPEILEGSPYEQLIFWNGTTIHR